MASVPRRGELFAERYRIEETLGKGGHGVVVAARDEQEQRDVALKILYVVTVENAERFGREARLAAKLESAHVVDVFGSGSHGGLPFLVMERLEGADLGALVKKEPLPLVRVADCVLQVCEALAHAHSSGIIHRDIKASNVFESPSGVVKILDFGVSRIDDEGDRPLTRTGHAGTLGSPPYMSPEHIRDPRRVDHRADIWALGVLTHFLLSRRYPFAGVASTEIFRAIVDNRREKLEVDVPRGVEEMIGRCLAPAREDRFADVGALARAIAPFASSTWHHYGEVVPSLLRDAAPRGPVTRSVPPPIEEQDGALADTVLATVPLPPPKVVAQRRPMALVAGLSAAATFAVIAIVFVLVRQDEPSLPSADAPSPIAIPSVSVTAESEPAESAAPSAAAATASPRKRFVRRPHATTSALPSAEVSAPPPDPSLLPNPYHRP